MNDKNYDTLVRIIDEDMEAVRYSIASLGQDLFYEDESFGDQLDAIELALDYFDQAIEQLNIIKQGELK